MPSKRQSGTSREERIGQTFGWALSLYLKLRSQRANLFGFYFFGYFYLNGLPQAASSLLVPTLACDSSNFHVRAKKFIESDTFLRMQTSL